MIKRLFLYLLLILLLLCNAAVGASGAGRTEEESVKSDQKYPRMPIRYARGFEVEYRGSSKLVTVFKPWRGAEVDFRYLLIPRGSSPPKLNERGIQIIEVPVRSIVTMSTTYLAYLDMLDLLDRLVGHDNFAYVNNPKVRRLASEKKIRAVGEGSAVNLEVLIDLQPDLIMTSSLGGEWDVHSKLTEAGFKVVLNGEYMETTPLGRSEWIKFIALFFDRENQAEEIFQNISQRYESLRERAGAMKHKPTVFTDAPYQGNWWIPGGGSYMAQFIEDAGARYIWSDDPSAGSRLLDFEAIYEAAHTADFWINPGTWRSLREGLATDERFVEFAAFRQGKVFNNNLRANPHGGNDYWESGVAKPYEILADLIKIFHPELLPEHELKYYRQLTR